MMTLHLLRRSCVAWFCVLAFLIAPAAHASFSDVLASHPNHAAIEYLQEKGILQGYPDGTFRPDTPVNRVEALKMILLGNNIQLSAAGAQLFPDTPATAWYASYLQTAKNLGIVRGYDDGTFKPDQTVSLVENLKIALLSAHINTSGLTIDDSMYADIQHQQSAWYAPYLQYAKNNHLVDADSGNRINAAQGMTRGKLAELMYRMMTATATPVDTGTLPGIVITVDPTRDRKKISPYIYGSNIQEAGGNLFRLGGNRWTAYNWTNNASNAGTDWGPFSSDGFLSDSDTPGQAVLEPVQKILAAGGDALVTIPIVDFVAADKAGLVHDVASDSNTRWVRNLATSNPAFPHAVTQDAFLRWLQDAFAKQLAAGRQIFISLDNEPALWSSTHALVHPQPVTYAEMVERTTTYATMIKQVMPNALVFGAVSYGYMEFERLQNASDALNRNYLGFFLARMKDADAKAGKRLLDVLDLHWYPEARGDGKRITENNGATQSAGEVTARLQAPRSLWDSSYIEDSWIARDYLGNKPVQLLPYVQNLIDTNYPGTKLSISEYNFGGADHISGGLAQADILGVFGKYGLFSAMYWPLSSITAQSYVPGAFDLFLNYDGKNSHVGDTSIAAVNPDTQDLSSYAFADDAGHYYLLLINKTNATQAVTALFQNASVAGADMYVLSAEHTTPHAEGRMMAKDNVIYGSVPAMSAMLLVTQ